MKTRFLWLSLCLIVTQARCATPTTDEPGIKFFMGSWKDVLAEAKRQNKPVFVDIFTTWCGPCKMMAKEAFPNAKVGEKFNANFISYQIDAEKGEGIEVARKYAVDSYPTSLYVSANGELIYRAIGYGGIKGMLDEADRAIGAAKDPNPLSALEKQYEGGKRDPIFLANYLAKRAQVGMPNGKALDGYLNVVPETEWSSNKNIELIADNLESDNAKAFDILMQKLKEVRSITDKESVAFGNRISVKLGYLIDIRFKQAISDRDEQLFEAVIKTNEEYLTLARNTKLDENQANDLANEYRMRFYQQTKNVDKYRALASAEATKLMAVSIDSVRAKNEAAYKRFQMQTAMMPDSVKNKDDFKQYAESMKNAETGQMAMKLNNIAWAYYENMTDKKDLSQALTWSAKSLEYERSGMYLDTYAHLLSKLGRKAEAIKTQEEAIAKTKAAGQDTADYERGLAEIKRE